MTPKETIILAALEASNKLFDEEAITFRLKLVQKAIRALTQTVPIESITASKIERNFEIWAKNQTRDKTEINLAKNFDGSYRSFDTRSIYAAWEAGYEFGINS